MEKNDITEIKTTLSRILSILERKYKPVKGNRYLSTREAADYIGVSIHTLYSWRRSGRQIVPCTNRERPLRYKIEDLDIFMKDYMKWERKEK